MKIAEVEGGRLKVTFRFPYGDPQFQETLEKVKTLPDRKFSKKAKEWDVPNIKEVRDKLVEWGFQVPEIEEKEVSLEGADERLYPFQREGLEKALRFGGRILLAMDMGTGKTACALSYLQIRPEERPVVIVVPASVKIHWMREIQNWMGWRKERVITAYGRKKLYFRGASIVIINYDILADHVEELVKIEPKALIVDECQYIKNTDANRSQAVIELGEVADCIIALSGTPILNRPSEFWTTLNLLRPDIWNRKSSFLWRYCAPKRNWVGGWTFDGATNTKELNRILNDEVMYRVLKHDVLDQLPDKIYDVVPFEPDNLNKYRAAEFSASEYTREVKGTKSAGLSALDKLRDLKDLAYEGKQKQVVKWIHDFLESGEKLVVFCYHHRVVDYLVDQFNGKSVKIDGRDSMDKRDKSIQDFQKRTEVRLLVANIQAGGVGIDGLQNVSSNVAFAELDWVPANMDQAADRLHRIGQKDTVNVYYLIAKGTIEEDMADIIDEKRKMVTSVVDGVDASDDSLIKELMKRISSR